MKNQNMERANKALAKAGVFFGCMEEKTIVKGEKEMFKIKNPEGNDDIKIINSSAK